ncbi:aspartate/glutamate racemase family protein [Vibrio agarivorans]|uniref:aspartate/glutamate racemase family protein n=1 Tax=Vibrio agarivorans TaxID=153622 RepID=UPI00222FC97E|nr:amino acid racemase [Vibrio agarivorans]MDN3663453.1 amino acid racemase [Vibrio agarivorans]
MKKVRFGVIGNMGPEADALFQDIVAKMEIEHGALKDQDHMGMIVVKNPDIPDRSEAINEGGKDPVPEMVKSAKLLEQVNVQFAVMTCNTAHYFRERVQAKTDVYIVDMLKTTVDRIKAENPESVVGILCTNGTYNSGIYDTYLQQENLVFVKPDSYAQEHYVHSAIYGETTGEKTACGQAIRETNGIKSGEFERNAELLSKAIERFQTQGVTSVILGCTELPLVRNILQQKFPDIQFIDPMEAVADRVVCLYKQAEERTEIDDREGLLQDPMDVHTDQEIVDYIVSRA